MHEAICGIIELADQSTVPAATLLRTLVRVVVFELVGQLRASIWSPLASLSSMIAGLRPSLR